MPTCSRGTALPPGRSPATRRPPPGVFQQLPLCGAKRHKPCSPQACSLGFAWVITAAPWGPTLGLTLRVEVAQNAAGGCLPSTCAERERRWKAYAVATQEYFEAAAILAVRRGSYGVVESIAEEMPKLRRMLQVCREAHRAHCEQHGCKRTAAAAAAGSR